MDALELIKTRRSTRRYLQRPVEPEKLSIILEAGRYAPSGGNNQSTHLIVIKNRDILTEIASCRQRLFWDTRPLVMGKQTAKNGIFNRRILHQ